VDHAVGEGVALMDGDLAGVDVTLLAFALQPETKAAQANSATARVSVLDRPE